MAYDTGEITDYIRLAAARRGIDPETALRVINQESGFNPDARNLSAREQSYGLMQLNAQGGLGVSALKAGIDIRDPATWRQQVDFGLNTVAKDGWRQWYGARDVGIGRWDGIRSGPATQPRPPGAPPAALTSPTSLVDSFQPQGPAPAVLGDIVGQTPVRAVPFEPAPSFGDLLAGTMQARRQRQDEQGRREAADMQRRSALFGGYG